jgi:uncharacterized protein with HEPN domain
MPGEPRNLAPADRQRLEHVLRAAKDVTAMIAGRDRADLDADMMLRRALLHAITEIGEAAARVSDPARSLLPSVPWDQIVATRNILVHVYWGVDLDIVWSVASNRMSELTMAIEALFRKQQANEK